MASASHHPAREGQDAADRLQDDEEQDGQDDDTAASQQFAPGHWRGTGAASFVTLSRWRDSRPIRSRSSEHAADQAGRRRRKGTLLREAVGPHFSRVSWSLLLRRPPRARVPVAGARLRAEGLKPFAISQTARIISCRASGSCRRRRSRHGVEGVEHRQEVGRPDGGPASPVRPRRSRRGTSLDRNNTAYSINPPGRKTTLKSDPASPVCADGAPVGSNPG